MADKMKDAEDRLLESLLASPPLADDGFSAQVVGKLRRQIWLRRLTVPVAALIGAAIAFEPMTGLVGLLMNASSFIPTEFVAVATSSLPQLPVVVLGAILTGACFLGVRFLEE